MAVPKRKKSRSRSRTRRARWKADRPALVPVVIDGAEVKVPGRLVRAYQRGLLKP
ncbi:50S ribosomal protein L32 [Actinocorallia sp. API 0066]|uniref:50S ribosomal protein L32 n=1 Tax=Actinocorallia sp. API 0066 TaxID=2896846 RepID=UPI001E51B965|nr:50S ribosomal protein L32 [Actinocorallia sp. API 0066]MCD0453004.1 50S ribosomal protein L32 [Actinocorallia sp. API 0066]